MAENDIKTKIVLEGEKEYKQALKDANRELKTLKSELKAETAELGKNATAQEKNAVKVKNLQKQIAEQEKIVKTYRKALEEVREKYGDNAEEVSKWEQKLNNARTTLANMKNDLEGVGDGFKAIQTDAGMATVATKSAADAIGTLADIGGSISDAIEGIFTGMLSTVKEAISDIWTDVVDLAARSNGLVDLAGFWNTDVQTVQKYGYAVQAISGSLEDLAWIVNKVNTLDSKKIAELTGVSGENYTDRWKYAMAVMDAMSEMSPEQRNIAGEELFGRNQTKAYDLLNDWKNMQKELAEVGTKGYGLSDEELSRMSELYDRVNKLRASWQSLKDMATVQLFGQLSMDLTGNAQAIVDGFLAYFNADSDQERDEAIKAIETNITDMFERIKKAIQDGIDLIDKIAEDMKGSENPTVQAIGNLMGGLADALQWFTKDNMENVLWSLGALATFWIAGKGLQFASTVAELATNIKALSLFKGLGSLGGLGGVGETIGASAGNTFLASLRAGLPAVLGVALITSGFMWALDQRKNHKEEVRGTEEHLEAQTGDANQLLADYVEAQKKMAETDIVNATAEEVEALQSRIERTRAALLENENGQKALDAYSDWRQENSMGNMDWELPENMKPVAVVPAYEWEKKPEAQRAITDEQMAAVEAFWDVLREKGADFTDEEWDAYEKAFQGQEELFDKIDDMMNYLMQTEDNWRGIEDLPADWWLHSANQGEGITNENLSAFNSLPNKMEKAVARAVSGIRVSIDGRTAGQILAPYVSESIASNIS